MRHYYFENSEIPPEYAFVMENEGVYYGPTRSVYIGYAPEEFLRLCQLELDTNAEHAIDGERVLYRRLAQTTPLERPPT